MNMTERNRTMINIEPSVFEEMRVLSDATGIPIATYGKLLIQSGLPILKTMREAIVERDDFMNNKLDALSGIIDDLIWEGQDLHYEKVKRDEHQHELENLTT